MTAVILQPDDSLAFLPAWMLDELAARYTIHESPTFSLAFLQLLRAEIDALLASLPSDSKAGDDSYASKKRDAQLARRRAEKSLELRAATSLARLWCDQGKRADARELLTPVYDWFTEGLDLPDLKNARVLIDALARQP